MEEDQTSISYYKSQYHAGEPHIVVPSDCSPKYNCCAQVARLKELPALVILLKPALSHKHLDSSVASASPVLIDVFDFYLYFS